LSYNMPKKSRSGKNRPKGSQMMVPAPGVPERLMDGKTFVFNEYVAIAVPMQSGNYT